MNVSPRVDPWHRRPLGSRPLQSDMRSRILDTGSERKLTDARGVLAELHAQLAAIPATADDVARLSASIRQLDDFFLLVIVGEFNAGKSALINALIGTRVLEEGVTPTTAQIHLVRHGPEPATQAGPDGTRIVTAPLEVLRDLHIVDTPGTNAILREHERLTTDFVPRSDLVLFVTSADRPFAETERAFLETIRDWGKKVVFIVNKVDIFASDEELEEVMAFVRDAAARQLGETPEIFAVSARLAWRAKTGEPSVWAASRFEALERFIRETLDTENRFRLKLANPLGVGDALARRYGQLASERLTLLATDLAAIDDVERQLAIHREDVARGFALRMTEIEKVLLDLEARGHDYFDETLRVGRVFDLLNRARVQKEFEEKVVGDAPREVERRVTEIVDWLVDQDFQQWQAVTNRLAARIREHGDRLLGSPQLGRFHADRVQLVDSVGREALRVVESYDRRREAGQIADAARNAVAATAAVGAGAVGLGTAVTLAATTAAADITGVVMAGVLAALGFVIIPSRRRRARADMREKITALRARLTEALRIEFTRAQTRAAERLTDAISPYTRFVRAEQRRWSDTETRLATLRDRTVALLTDLETPSAATRARERA